MVLLLAVLVLQLRPRDAALNQQMLDLKNQMQEMKTAQLQAQNQALLQQSGQLNEIMRTVNENLSKSQGNITSQLGQTGVVGEIQQKLGLLEESTNQMKAIGKDISSLQDILRAPKLRGNLGEYLLEDLLRQVLPAGNFTLQYAFPDGAKVDAVITLGERLIPVDAKFPLESFVRLFEAGDEEGRKKHRKEFVKSFKLRVDEIAEKYIRPDCGTYDFALIYIPAENVFYEAVISDGLDGQQLRHLQLRRGKARHPGLAQQLLRLPDGHRLRPQGAEDRAAAPSRSSRTWSRCRRASPSSTATSACWASTWATPAASTTKRPRRPRSSRTAWPTSPACAASCPPPETSSPGSTSSASINRDA